MTPIHLQLYFEQAHAQPWQEIPIAQVDHYQWRMIYALGEYPWHQHDERDDCLWVLAGCLGVDLPDGVVQVRGKCWWFRVVFNIEPFRVMARMCCCLSLWFEMMAHVLFLHLSRP